MATLTVWKFHTVEGADNALSKLEDLQKQQLIQVLDAAIVSALCPVQPLQRTGSQIAG
jgi:uncharacterized membrane protein